MLFDWRQNLLHFANLAGRKKDRPARLKNGGAIVQAG